MSTSEPLVILCGDVLMRLRELPSESVQCCVTSPPYWGLRDYGCAGQLGLEKTPEEYVANMVQIFREVRRVLRDDGTLWLNLGDSYANNPASAVNRNGLTGSLNNGKADFECRTGTRGDQKRAKLPDGLKPKDLVGIPWMVAFALRSDGWYLRSDIIWHKPNPMPESVTDRPTKSHEYLFLLTKSQRYYYDAEAILEYAAWAYFGEQTILKPQQGTLKWMNGRGNSVREQTNTRNKRSVWSVATSPYPDAHFATYPPDLIKPCILAGSKPGDTILDPFGGSGTTGMVALELGRKAVLIELNPEYCKLIERRCNVTLGLALTSVPDALESEAVSSFQKVRRVMQGG